VSRMAAVSILLVGLSIGLSAGLHAAEEAAPSTYVTLKFEGACDDRNNRLWLTNSHSYKTVVTRVRWRAAGGKDLNEEFYPSPNSTREIGCAAEAEILDAQFAAF
jgi:hypothetical protein